MEKRTYGSEYQLFEYRRHWPEALDNAILSAIGAEEGPLDWLYPRDPDAAGTEPEGLRFIPEVSEAWREAWPQRGSQQCWDGVASTVNPAGTTSWVLMEAKANEPEFAGGPCGATLRSPARSLIERTLGRTKSLLGVHRDVSWLGSYYQYANRLAALHVLTSQGIQAHLVYVYFVGEVFPDGRACPQDEARWRQLMRARDLTLGLPTQHALSPFIHSIFLAANPQPLDHDGRPGRTTGERAQ